MSKARIASDWVNNRFDWQTFAGDPTGGTVTTQSDGATTPNAGDQLYDTTNEQMYQWDAGLVDWVKLGGDNFVDAGKIGGVVFGFIAKYDTANGVFFSNTTPVKSGIMNELITLGSGFNDYRLASRAAGTYVMSATYSTGTYKYLGGAASGASGTQYQGLWVRVA